MRKLIWAAAPIAVACSLAAASWAASGAVDTGQSIAAPDGVTGTSDTTTPACTSPAPVHTYAWYHCYTPTDIRDAYGVNAVGDPSSGTGLLGAGQTIVLVDSYGSPTAASDLQYFHDTFYPNLPNPDFTTVFPNGAPDYNNVANGNGQSGSSGAAGWSGEATLDIEWSYAIAPLAHIVLLAVPPAETEGVQGFPTLFNAISDAVDTYPAGTVFSMSFGVTEQTFGGAAQQQAAKFDAVFQKGNAKGDTFFASSGDDGSFGVSKQHRDSAGYDFATVGWPASSPYVTAVGGTQLQYGWTWNPTCDVPFDPTTGANNACYFGYKNRGNTEAVWNESWEPAATGGGESVIYPQPTWQSSVASRISGDHRGLPDLAWNAAVNGGVLVYITAFPNYQRAGWHVYGGTSAASPQVAALVALANESRHDAGKGPIGFLNPTLYTLGSSAFHDIVPVTEGSAASGQLKDNNLWSYNADGSVSPSSVPGMPTTRGWDETTGFGSPRAGAFVDALTAQP